jgi:hypothetical protein
VAKREFTHETGVLETGVAHAETRIQDGGETQRADGDLAFAGGIRRVEPVQTLERSRKIARGELVTRMKTPMCMSASLGSWSVCMARMIPGTGLELLKIR